MLRTFRQSYIKRYPGWVNSDRLQERNKVNQLPELPTREMLEAINSAFGSWLRIPYCNNCEADDGRLVVELGEPFEYDSTTIYLCGSCLRSALGLIDGKR